MSPPPRYEDPAEGMLNLTRLDEELLERVREVEPERTSELRLIIWPVNWGLIVSLLVSAAITLLAIVGAAELLSRVV